jgi:tRNA threonylcarbamoyladenosine biosynthesis protein TsaE
MDYKKPQVYFEIILESEEKTNEFGKNLGKILQKGDNLALIGNLGAGKTRLAQGIAVGTGVSENAYVTSPTFTIINEHSAGKLTFYHVDLYRLSDPDELLEIGFDDLLRDDGILVCEWWNIFPHDIPNDTLHVLIESLTETTRKIQLGSYDNSWENRLKLLKL